MDLMLLKAAEELQDASRPAEKQNDGQRAYVQLEEAVGGAVKPEPMEETG